MTEKVRALELLRQVEREETVVTSGGPAKKLSRALLVATEEFAS